MKVLQVCAIDVSVEALLKPLIKALSDNHTVHNACTNTGRFTELRKQNLHMIDVPIDRKINPVSNIKSTIQLYSLIKKQRYDVVHVHTPVAAILGRIAAKLAGVKHIIYTAHGFYFHEGMPKNKYKFFYWLEKLFARYLTNWLFLQSKEDYNLCLEQHFKKEDFILHISNGVDVTTKFNPALVNSVEKRGISRNLGIRQEDIVFCFIGRLVEEKGIFELLRAFNHLKRNTKLPVKLLVIGETSKSERDQQSYEFLKKMLEDPAVIHVGYRRDVPKLLSIIDVFVLPSYREGLPRSIIEAMAMEKPVIATNIRGSREEVIHGENGYLVRKKDCKELYERMSELANNREKRIRFGKSGREIAANFFDENIVIKKQLEIYNLINNKLKSDETYETYT